jgi:cytosine/adenosine deaminase-related metal-dependent hydrolase
VHIHLAEADADVEITREKFGRSILDRFENFGILCGRSLLAHCVHLTPREFEKVRASGAWLVHNPRSNMNNRVGRAPLREFGSRGVLGTDGFPPDMFEELRSAYLSGRDEGGAGGPDPADLQRNGQRLLSEIFQKPFGILQEGAPADLVVVEYRSPTPVTGDNLDAHVVFGFRSSMVESVMVGGAWVLHGRVFPALDEGEVLRRAQDAARKLWSAMHGIG